jgi:hypothetical protein
MKQSIARNVFRDSQAVASPASPVSPAAMGYLWSRTHMLKDVSQVLHEVADWQEVAIAPDRNGLRLSLNGVMLGQLRWNGRIEIPFAPAVRDELVAEEMAQYDPEDPDAPRVVFDVRGAEGVNRALWLLRIAYLSVNSKCDARPSDVAQPSAHLLGRSTMGRSA